MPYYYLLLFFIVSFWSILEAIDVERRIQIIGFFIVSFLLFFTSGLKYETGVDWLEYTYWFEDIFPINRIFDAAGRENIFEKIDWGYNLLSSSIKFIGGDIQLVFFVTALISIIFLCKALTVFSTYPINGLLIYFALIYFNLDLNGIRQGAAICIYFFALKYVFLRQPVKYVIFTLLAASFHWSTYLLIPIYFVLINRYSSKRISLFFLIFFSVFLFGIKWIETAIDVVFYYSPNKEIINRALIYTTDEAFSSARSLDLRTITNIGINLSIFCLLLYFRKQLEQRFKFFNLFLNLYLIQMFIYFAFYELVVLSERFKYFGLLSNIILLPCFIALFPRRIEKGFMSLGIILYALVYSNAYIFERKATISYAPYQNYIIYKAFGIESTGRKRLMEQQKVFESYNKTK